MSFAFGIIPWCRVRIVIYGFIYDVKTGRLVEVPEASKAGLPA